MPIRNPAHKQTMKTIADIIERTQKFDRHQFLKEPIVTEQEKKTAKEQYDRGYEDGYRQAIEDGK